MDQLCPSSRAPLLFQVDIRSVQRHPETPVHVAGFHLPSKVRLVLAGGAGCQMCANADTPLSQKSAEARTRPPQVQEVTHAHDFSSFLFWREPLPRVDGELLSLLVSLLLGQHHQDASSNHLLSSPPGSSGGAELQNPGDTRTVHSSSRSSVSGAAAVQQLPVLEGTSPVHPGRAAGDAGPFGAGPARGHMTPEGLQGHSAAFLFSH